MFDDQKPSLTGIYAGLLAAAEVGLGSALHAAHIPLRGQFLSLNQIFLLICASKEGGKTASRFSPAVLSNAAAVLKSLSPVGKKLTPMLAIAMQGWLFSCGTFLFGHTFLGRIIGGILASFWAFLQPLLLYGAIFGPEALLGSFKEFGEIFPFSEQALLGCVCGLAAFKALIVAGLCFSPSSWASRWVAKLSRYADQKPPSSRSPFKGAIKQICSPLFLASIGVTAVLLYYAKGSSASLIGHLLRPLAIGFLLFYAIRVFPIEKFVKRQYTGSFGQTLAIAIQRLKNHSMISTESPTDKKP